MSKEASNPVVDDEDAMGVALAELRDARTGDVEPTASVPVEAAEPDSTAKPDKTTEPAEAQAPAKVKTAEERLADAETELHRLRSDAGRVSALNRKYQESSQEAAKLREQLAAAQKPPETQAEARYKLDALSDQIKGFPELESIVDAVRDALTEVEGKAKAHATQAAQEAVKPLEPLRQRQLDQDAQQQEAAFAADLSTFTTTYPTAVAVVKTDDFKTWLPKQSPAIQWAFA